MLSLVVLIKALLVVGFHDSQVLRKAKQSSLMCIAMAGQWQQLLGHCFSVLMNSFEMTNGLQPPGLRLSSQYQREGW